MRELVYYVAVTLDGYIAGPEHQIGDFLYEGDHMDAQFAEFPDAVPTAGAAQLGLDPHIGRFSTVLMGANTHGVGLPGAPNPYSHLEQIVFTHRDLPEAENLRVTAEDPVEVVRELRHRGGKDIWLCGGAQLATQLRGEIDRLILKRQPLLFGNGVPLFAPGDYAPMRLDLVRTQNFASGVSVMEYLVRR